MIVSCLTRGAPHPIEVVRTREVAAPDSHIDVWIPSESGYHHLFIRQRSAEKLRERTKKRGDKGGGGQGEAERKEGGGRSVIMSGLRGQLVSTMDCVCSRGKQRCRHTI